VRRPCGRSQGQLHVAASMTVAEYLVPQWLIRLRTTDRDMRVSLEMGNSEHVIDLVRDRRAELGFVEGHSTLAGLRSQVVLDDELLVVVEPCTRGRRAGVGYRRRNWPRHRSSCAKWVRHP